MNEIGLGSHPGLLLKAVILPELQLSVSRAAREIGVSRQALHRLMAGHANVSLDMAIKLERFCGVPSWFWLQRQAAYDLSRTIVSSNLSIVTHALSSETLREIGLNDS
jgi:addiction module HigA family antidote